MLSRQQLSLGRGGSPFLHALSSILSARPLKIPTITPGIRDSTPNVRTCLGLRSVQVGVIYGNPPGWEACRR